jgi:hypothetical protein
MPRGNVNYTLTSITRAVKAAERSGLKIDRMDITKEGTVRIFTRREIQPPKLLNEWDEVFDGEPKA